LFRTIQRYLPAPYDACFAQPTVILRRRGDQRFSWVKTLTENAQSNLVLITFFRWVAGALNSAWRCVYAMLAAHPELNPRPGEDIMRKFTALWGSSEEWDDRVLEKHVYLGRVLTQRRQAQSSL